MSDIILPIPIDTSPSRCPQCEREEKRIEVCAHCGYKYPDGALGVVGGLTIAGAIIGGGIFLVWIGITLLSWWTGDQSLREVLAGQWGWLKGLRF